jgi:hypothetical protein
VGSGRSLGIVEDQKGEGRIKSKKIKGEVVPML